MGGEDDRPIIPWIQPSESFDQTEVVLRTSSESGHQLKAEECGVERSTLPLNFSDFSGKPRISIFCFTGTLWDSLLDFGIK